MPFGCCKPCQAPRKGDTGRADCRASGDPQRGEDCLDTCEIGECCLSSFTGDACRKLWAEENLAEPRREGTWGKYCPTALLSNSTVEEGAAEEGDGGQGPQVALLSLHGEAACGESGLHVAEKEEHLSARDCGEEDAANSGDRWRSGVNIPDGWQAIRSPSADAVVVAAGTPVAAAAAIASGAVAAAALPDDGVEISFLADNFGVQGTSGFTRPATGLPGLPPTVAAANVAGSGGAYAGGGGTSSSKGNLGRPGKVSFSSSPTLLDTAEASTIVDDSPDSSSALVNNVDVQASMQLS